MARRASLQLTQLLGEADGHPQHAPVYLPLGSVPFFPSATLRIALFLVGCASICAPPLLGPSADACAKLTRAQATRGGLRWVVFEQQGCPTGG